MINGPVELPGLGQQVISITAGFCVIRGSGVMAERRGPAVLSQLKCNNNNNRTSRREKIIHTCLIRHAEFDTRLSERLFLRGFSE